MNNFIKNLVTLSLCMAFVIQGSMPQQPGEQKTPKQSWFARRKSQLQGLKNREEQQPPAPTASPQDPSPQEQNLMAQQRELLSRFTYERPASKGNIKKVVPVTDEDEQN